MKWREQLCQWQRPSPPTLGPSLPVAAALMLPRATWGPRRRGARAGAWGGGGVFGGRLWGLDVGTGALARVGVMAVVLPGLAPRGTQPLVSGIPGVGFPTQRLWRGEQP